MPSPLDNLMEHASARLTAMDYAGCEATCLRALAAAREARDWTYYARILMPLQESRRQRRLIAADTMIQFGTTLDFQPPAAGCVVVTRPCGEDDVLTWQHESRQQGGHVELLWCDAAATEPRWVVACPGVPEVHVQLDAPRGLPRNMPIDPAMHPAAAHWFVAASEALGDAALATVTAPPGSLERIAQLEALVAAVSDHEILHQRLGDAARAMIPAATR